MRHKPSGKAMRKDADRRLENARLATTLKSQLSCAHGGAQCGSSLGSRRRRGGRRAFPRDVRPSVTPSAVAEPCLRLPPAAGPRQVCRGQPTATVEGRRGYLCAAVLPRSPFKPSCNLLILRRDEKGQGEVWPAGQWWPRSAGRHSRSPLVPSGDGTGGRARRTRLGLQGNYVFGGFVKRGR